MANRFPWQRIDLTTPGVADETYAALAASSLAAQATLVHDPRWLAALAGEEQKSGRMYTLRDDTGLTGLATFIVHPSRLPLALGELTFFSRAVQRLDGLAPPLVRAADPERETTMCRTSSPACGRTWGRTKSCSWSPWRREPPCTT